jgi:hypothetical protein
MDFQNFLSNLWSGGDKITNPNLLEQPRLNPNFVGPLPNRAAEGQRFNPAMQGPMPQGGMNPLVQDPAKDAKREIMMQLLTKGQQTPPPVSQIQPQALDSNETQITQPAPTEQLERQPRKFVGARGEKPPSVQNMRGGM